MGPWKGPVRLCWNMDVGFLWLGRGARLWSKLLASVVDLATGTWEASEEEQLF